MTQEPRPSLPQVNEVVPGFDGAAGGELALMCA
jgi:hypothetical protein